MSREFATSCLVTVNLKGVIYIKRRRKYFSSYSIEKIYYRVDKKIAS